MGAGVSTEGAPLTRVKCKNNLGVLFDPAAEEKFYAAATGPEGEEAVPWPEADAYVKTRDERWRDPTYVLYQNLKAFSASPRNNTPRLFLHFTLVSGAPSVETPAPMFVRCGLSVSYSRPMATPYQVMVSSCGSAWRINCSGESF